MSALLTAEEISKAANTMYKELENIRITLINIRISVAHIKDKSEARALDTIADHIEQAVLTLEQEAKSMGVMANSIIEDIKHNKD